MKQLRLIITILICKTVLKLCRLFNRGGTTLPGKIARFLCPGMLGVMAAGFNVIFVTGTNGKTTTSRIIGKILEENGIGYISNRSGSNLVGGVFSTFIEHARINGKFSNKTALIEIDEAAFPVMADYLKPNIIVVTNFFRDQLDRYGELYTTLGRVKEGITKCPGATLILNADDSLSASLGRDGADHKTVFYGFEPAACTSGSKAVNSDASFCVYCRERYEYSFHTYAHLGGFSCPSCGYTRPEPDVGVAGIFETTSDFSKILLRFGKTAGNGAPTHIEATVNLPGLYNIYNALAAAACGYALGFPAETINTAMSTFECGFGRMEVIKDGGRTIRVILVKNSAGFNQVLSYLLMEEKPFNIAFLINDKIADGTDISWLWDVEFEKLMPAYGRIGMFIASGTRAEDMAVRLKYAGIPTDRISIMKDYGELVNTALELLPPGGTLYLLPSYTAMLDVRKVLNKRFKIKNFWEQ